MPASSLVIICLPTCCCLFNKNKYGPFHLSLCVSVYSICTSPSLLTYGRTMNMFKSQFLFSLNALRIWLWLHSLEGHCLISDNAAVLHLFQTIMLIAFYTLSGVCDQWLIAHTWRTGHKDIFRNTYILIKPFLIENLTWYKLLSVKNRGPFNKRQDAWALWKLCWRRHFNRSCIL